MKTNRFSVVALLAVFCLATQAFGAGIDDGKKLIDAFVEVNKNPSISDLASLLYYRIKYIDVKNQHEKTKDSKDGVAFIATKESIEDMSKFDKAAGKAYVDISRLALTKVSSIDARAFFVEMFKYLMERPQVRDVLIDLIPQSRLDAGISLTCAYKELSNAGKLYPTLDKECRAYPAITKLIQENDNQKLYALARYFNYQIAAIDGDNAAREKAKKLISPSIQKAISAADLAVNSTTTSPADQRNIYYDLYKYLINHWITIF